MAEAHTTAIAKKSGPLDWLLMLALLAMFIGGAELAHPDNEGPIKSARRWLIAGGVIGFALAWWLAFGGTP